MIPFSCFVCSLLGLLLFYLDIPVIMSRLIILAGQDGPCGKKSKVELVSYGFICSSLLLRLIALIDARSCSFSSSMIG